MPSGASVLDGHHHLCDTNGVQHMPRSPRPAPPPPRTKSASVFGQMSHLVILLQQRALQAHYATDYEAAEHVCKEGVLDAKWESPGFFPINVYLYMQTTSRFPLFHVFHCFFEQIHRGTEALDAVTSSSD